jgi:hypothetical protein
MLHDSCWKCYLIVTTFVFLGCLQNSREYIYYLMKILYQQILTQFSLRCECLLSGVETTLSLALGLIAIATSPVSFDS